MLSFRFISSITLYASFCAQTHDYIEFYSDEARTVQYGERYHGGRGGGDKKYPGIGVTPPLVIPAESFVAHFHSDGSNVDWGFKCVPLKHLWHFLVAVCVALKSPVCECFSTSCSSLNPRCGLVCRFTARAELLAPKPLERMAGDPESVTIDNSAPFFLGRAPYSVFSEPPAPIVLSDVRVCPTAALTQAQVLERFNGSRGGFTTAKLQPLLTARPDQSGDRVLDVLALASNALSISRVGLQADALLQLLLPLVAPFGGYPIPAEVRTASCRVLRLTLAGRDVSMMDGIVSANTPFPSFPALLHSQLLSSVNVWVAPVLASLGQPVAGFPSVPQTLGLTQEYIAILRQCIAQVCVHPP